MKQTTLDDLARRRAEARALGGEDAIAKLHGAGKLTARERIDLLLDPGSFQEFGLLARSQYPGLRERTPADGVVVGSGTIDGRLVFVTSEDATVLAGTRGRVAEAKTARMRELAIRERKPFIALMEAGAGRFQENNGAIAAAMGARFGEHYRMSGLTPQVAAVMGACFGGPSFTAAQSDFISIVEDTGFLGMSGPAVVKVGMGQDVSAEAIGGARKVATERGIADHLAADERACIAAIRCFLSFFPSSAFERPPVAAPTPAPVDGPEGRRLAAEIVSDGHRWPYDMNQLLPLFVDGGDLFFYKADYGPNLITAWGRMAGHSVGFIANNPKSTAGAMDEKTAVKARRFIDICDAFHIPIVFLVDCPGFMVGPQIEDQRMVVLAAQLLSSGIGASVPKITIVLRKAIGLAYIALGGKAMGVDRLYAWPTGRFDVMGPAAGVDLVHKKDIARAADPAARRAELVAKAEAESSAYIAAEMGLIDDVIHPAETRDVILAALASLRQSAPPPAFKHRIAP